MVIFKRGVDTGFPAASGRWETSLSLILFPVVLLVACFTASGMTVQQQSGNAKTADKPPTATQKAGPQKSKPWRVKVIDDAGVPVFSVHAKKSLLGDVAAEIERQLKLPIILTAKAKQQLLTTDFDDVPLESALRLLSVTAVVDYVVTGGADPMAPTEKKPLSVYLIAKDETPPEVGPWIFKDPGTQMLVGMVYETEDEEKAALEVKKRDLQVAYKDGLFALHVHKQFLTDVLEEVAGKAGIPFSILTTNGSQNEIDKVVSWDIGGATLEDLTRTWFPNGVRLYWRTDLVKDVSKPLRLTIEQTQAAQNITP